jgi:hypothetical protein
MQPPVAEGAPRGCLIVAIHPTASMAAPVRALGGTSGLSAASALAGSLLQGLAELRADGRLTAAWDVAVVATGTEGGPSLRNLLGGGSDHWPFVPLEQLQPGPVQVAEVRGEAGNGGLARAAGLLQSWTLTQRRPLRPLVVYCSDEAGLGPDLLAPADVLRVQCDARGRPFLAVCGFSGEVHRRVSLMCPEATLRGPWRLAWACASGKERHALSLNAVSPERLLLIARKLSEGTQRSPGWTLGSGTPAACEARVLRAPSSSKTDDECEDEYAVDAEQGRAIVADGASQGIFVGDWAGLLARRFLHFAGDPTDPDCLSEPLAECRRQWRSGIGYGELHALSQDKVDALGAASTLLALSLQKTADGHRWRAAGVGDGCLFWVRGEGLLASFPLCRSADFGVAPDLIPTRRQLVPNVRLLTAEGLGEVGDLYGLATDAVAQFLLQSLETGQTVNWQRYWDMDARRWRDELKELRARRLIADDDSTLVLLRVTR